MVQDYATALQTPMPASNFQQIQAPAGGYDNSAMVGSLAGGIASRNNAAANQSITGAARRMGGDTTSPAFQFLSQMAKTGAAGNTGGQVAQLKFNAANAGQQMELQRQQSNQSAALQAQSIANQFATQMGSQQMGQMQFQLQALQAASSPANRLSGASSMAGNTPAVASQFASLAGLPAGGNVANWNASY